MPSMPRSRGSGRGSDGSPRSQVVAPMSERQQLALVMQLSSQEAPPASSNPGEDKKKPKPQRNERGETPLHVAAIKGDHETVRKLLHQGQDPDVVDFAGWTALHEACSYGWFQVVVVLVNGGANVNAKGLDDDTPLHDATTSGNIKMVEFLIDHGADPFVKNAKGKMPSDYAAPHIYEYLQALNGECSIDHGSTDSNTSEYLPKKRSKAKSKSKSKSKSRSKSKAKSKSKRKSKSKKRDKEKDNSARGSTKGTRDDSSKKGGNASAHGENHKRTNMESLAQAEHYEGKEASSEKTNPSDNKDEGSQLSSGVVSSTQDEIGTGTKRSYIDENHEADPAEDEGSKRKKRKDNEEKEPMAKPAPVSRSGTGRVLTGSKPPGPASKTGAAPLGKGGSSQNAGKGSSGGSGGKGGGAAQGKGGPGSKASAQSGHAKSSGGSKGSGQSGKQDRKSPVASPKPNQGKDTEVDEEQKSHEAAPKVPPLKIVIPGGAGGASGRNEQEGEGGTQRGGGKGRGGSATLPYVIPCTSTDAGQTSDSSDGTDDKRLADGGKPGQRVLRSHRANDGDKERTSPQSGHNQALNSNKSPQPSGSGQDHHDHATSTSGKSESARGTSVELHPRKRKIKASKDSHSRESKNNDQTPDSTTTTHNITHSNPYQLYIHIRKQVERRQKALFPVKPKPPKDFNKYLMNRCTYTLQRNVSSEPQVEIPINLPPQMVNEFTEQEKERTRLRIQHLVEKEKLVLAVEQEILRVHGRAERAVANQALPFSVCTILRDKEVYNILAPEQEEKRNAQRSRCNGRQINSWLQEVDDKWEKIKEGMLRRQHTEAETLHAVQIMGWEWKLKELGLCDYKTSPKIEQTHVPQIHVSNFDLPA